MAQVSTTVQTRSRRQAGLTALYLGLFATVWFSVPGAGGLLRTLALLGYAVTTLAGSLRRG
jgi:hypothetical protein